MVKCREKEGDVVASVMAPKPGRTISLVNEVISVIVIPKNRVFN